MPDQNFMGNLEIYEMPPDTTMMDCQALLQFLITQHKPGAREQLIPSETYGNLLERVRMNWEAIQNEMAEIMDLLPWKEWKTYKERGPGDPISQEDLVELRFELIDILHFILNIGLALGMDNKMLNDLYYTKNLENRRRQREGY